MGYQHWHFTKDKEGTAWLEIDVKDSSVNILRVEVMQEWAEIMKEVAADSSLTGLCMVSGKPGGFVYGADIAEFNTLASEADVHNLIALAASVLSAIEKLDIPTVCGIDGVAVGGGLEIALPFDRIVGVGQRHTKLGFPEINLGIFPGYGAVNAKR